VEQLKPRLADGFSGVMITAEPVSGYEGLSDYWKRIQALIGKGGTYAVSVDAERSTLFGDIAIAKGITRDTVVTGGKKEYHYVSHWTAVLHREGGVWKLLRVQASMDPYGNPFVKEQVKEAALWSGGGMLVLGGLLGSLFSCKRRAKVSA
jgi:hypothetical protein